MAQPALADYYEDLGVKPTATQQEIEATHARRVAELRASQVEDAPEELAEVEGAFAVLSNPAKRAYDAQLREAEAEEDKKNAELDAYLQRSSRRRHQRNRRSGGLLDANPGYFELLEVAPHPMRYI